MIKKFLKSGKKTLRILISNKTNAIIKLGTSDVPGLIQTVHIAILSLLLIITYLPHCRIKQGLKKLNNFPKNTPLINVLKINLSVLFTTEKSP